MNLTIGCLYSCNVCGIKDAEVQVPARGAEDVIAWMNGTLTPHLVADHEQRSPGCRPQSLSQVKIPMPAGTDRVGGAPAQ